jgi:hypothetical protein
MNGTVSMDWRTTEARAAAEDATARRLIAMFDACRVMPRVVADAQTVAIMATEGVRRPCPAGCDNGVIIRDGRIEYCPTCGGLGSVEED